MPVFKTLQDQNKLVAPNPWVGKEDEKRGGARGKEYAKNCIQCSEKNAIFQIKKINECSLVEKTKVWLMQCISFIYFDMSSKCGLTYIQPVTELFSCILQLSSVSAAVACNIKVYRTSNPYYRWPEQISVLQAIWYLVVLVSCNWFELLPCWYMFFGYWRRNVNMWDLRFS
jgi:hypothetical protein